MSAGEGEGEGDGAEEAALEEGAEKAALSVEGVSKST